MDQPVLKPSPAELRANVIAVARKGEAPLRQIAKDFGISKACLHRWLKITDREDGVDRPSAPSLAAYDVAVQLCVAPPPSALGWHELCSAAMFVGA
jgi:transposase